MPYPLTRHERPTESPAHKFLYPSEASRTTALPSSAESFVLSLYPMMIPYTARTPAWTTGTMAMRSLCRMAKTEA
ncbi:hypothetical protein ACHAWF_016635 [Thalassiosira exigua]